MSPPVSIEVKKSAGVLRVIFADGMDARIGFDRLRACSPAADGKPTPASAGVIVTAVEMVGNYAIKPVFSDGHQSGIYSWDALRRLADGEE